MSSIERVKAWVVDVLTSEHMMVDTGDPAVRERFTAILAVFNALTPPTDEATREAVEEARECVRDCEAYGDSLGYITVASIRTLIAAAERGGE